MHNVTPDVIDLSICKTNSQYAYPKVQRLVAFVLNVQCSFEFYNCTVSRIQGQYVKRSTYIISTEKYA